MPRTRNPYPAEFREQSVALARAGRSVESLAREYEPCAATIHEWVRQAVADDGDDLGGLTREERDELRRLRREVKHLRQERGHPLKGRGPVCTKRRDIAEVFEFMTANQAEYSIQTMSRMLGVSRSGFHAYHSRPPSARSLADEALSKRSAAIHEASKKTCGAPRIHAELADEGVSVGRKRVERLMLAKGSRGVSRRKFVVTTERDPRVRPAADLVARNFYADAPNVLWVADITYVPTWTGFLYLAVVLDAFSRRVIGWAMGTGQRTQRVLGAMNMAVAQRKPDRVIHHSDQGSQYTSVAFGLRCKEMGVRPSMGSVGECYDNAMCESFFATLECELLDRRKFKTKAEARVACFEFIEGWYNPSRRHSALGYKSPINYQRIAAEGLESPSP